MYVNGKPGFWKLAALSLMALSLTAIFAAQSEAAGAWPKGKVSIIWHSGAGSGGDLLFRALGKFIESKEKVTVIIENVTGASGANAWNRSARAKPDGSVLQGVSSTFVASPVQNNIPVNYTNFDPVLRMFIDAVTIFVAGNSPYNTFEDFVADAKKRPGELTLTGGTAGNLEFVATRELMREIGIDAPIVPFEGGASGVAAIMGGHVTAGVGEYSEIAAGVAGGKIKVLATFNKLAGLNVPTLQELGYKTKLEKFRGIIVPKGTPQDVKDAIVEVVKAAMDDPEFKNFYTKNFLVPAFAVGDAFYKIMEQQTEDVKASIAAGKK